MDGSGATSKSSHADRSKPRKEDPCGVPHRSFTEGSIVGLEPRDVANPSDFGQRWEACQ
jgi:hypothetical protein